MPTGYTAKIESGLSFNDFVMGCARGMGACIMMRDESSETAIPEKFEPSDYNAKQLIEAKERLAKLQTMSRKAALHESTAEYNSAMESFKEECIKVSDLREKYEEMLRKVNQWVSPSKDHDHFKEFMVSQLVDSIRFDCYRPDCPIQLDISGWLDSKIKKAERDIGYHTKGDAEEIDRTESRNVWLKKLRESISE